MHDLLFQPATVETAVLVMRCSIRTSPDAIATLTTMSEEELDHINPQWLDQILDRFGLRGENEALREDCLQELNVPWTADDSLARLLLKRLWESLQEET